jgi:hypothetical protein
MLRIVLTTTLLWLVGFAEIYGLEHWDGRAFAKAFGQFVFWLILLAGPVVAIKITRQIDSGDSLKRPWIMTSAYFYLFFVSTVASGAGGWSPPTSLIGMLAKFAFTAILGIMNLGVVAITAALGAIVIYALSFSSTRPKPKRLNGLSDQLKKLRSRER